MLKPTQGFTIIELMISVAVIAILAALAIPTYRDYTIKSRVVEGITQAASIKLGVSDAFISDQAAGVARYASKVNPTALNLHPMATKHIYDITVNPASGSIRVEFKNDAGSGLASLGTRKVVMLTPYLRDRAAGAVVTLQTGGAGNIDWACTSTTNAAATKRGIAGAPLGTMPAKFAPEECR